jgi:putative copper resistance protein D
MELSIIWDIYFALCIIAMGVWYWLEDRSEISKIRQTLYYFALLLLTIVLVGPVAHNAINYFWVHMVQHILLMMLISPLLILGSPFKLLLNSRYLVLRKNIRRVTKLKLVRNLFRPQVGFTIFLVALIGTHFSPLANAAMNNPNIHVLELMIFLYAGLIYYYPVLEGNPSPFPVPHAVRVGSLFAMMLPETMTGFFLYSGNTLLHDVHHHMGMDMSSMIDPLRDQHIGGALMWSMGMIIDSIWIVLAARDWFAHEKLLSGDK